ncbi:unnamed protein product (macronuclear) [Paramecium tetraurelia]|uniref:E2F/DP family winged-helix DNA-binding domain-containing protein n=1 Tax=Paramecium tetraurelia TaxID=5888 RepID=A0CRL3_PARTE|nr:uncharacterized protein GSPATT00009745001 [Paramecium tetraurelia]CAK73430.1 unnamed protein product [Paramecium tetraurelia]|eukprot:XP_001440827.1 hypothetical protein (macronuclear) [Paramecium tetraurelia strain d4-2]
MDFTGQFRLDEDSMAINIFQTPIKGLIQGIFKLFISIPYNILPVYGGIFSRLYYNFANCNSQANTNQKLFVQTEPFDKPKIQSDLFKTQKKWSLKYISNRVMKELSHEAIAYSDICQQLTDEMIQELDGKQNDRQKEIKNLRRRVYDALNVMISIGIVVKENKMMKKNSEAQVNLTKQNLIIRKQKLKEQLQIKKASATTQIQQQDTLKKLVELNKMRDVDESEKIRFPFILVKTQLNNVDEDELVLEQNKQMDYLKVFSKNQLDLQLDLTVVQKLFQSEHMIL